MDCTNFFDDSNVIPFPSISIPQAAAGSGGSLKPPRQPPKRGPWEDDDGNGGSGPPRPPRRRYEKTALELECERQNKLREDELLAFAKHVLPVLYPGVKRWKYVGPSMPSYLRLEGDVAKALDDHGRCFLPIVNPKTRAKARSPKFVYLTMPYPNGTRPPTTGTVFAKKTCESHWPNARAHPMRAYALPPEMSWHLPNRSELWLFVRECDPQPVEWRAYPSFDPAAAEVALQGLRLPEKAACD